MAPNRAAHKPQPVARFRNLGKRGFPKLRREADALHQRWEAKRPRTLPLSQKTGVNGQVQGRHVSEEQSAALRQLGNLAVPKLCGIVLFGRVGAYLGMEAPLSEALKNGSGGMETWDVGEKTTLTLRLTSAAQTDGDDDMDILELSYQVRTLRDGQLLDPVTQEPITR